MGNQNPKLKKNRSQTVCGGGCMASHDLLSLDHDELSIFKVASQQPKGKICPKSIAFLSKDEINFFKASAGRNISALRFYLKKGVHINTFDEDRTSPLHVAARHASIQVIEELLNCGSMIDMTDIDGWTPMHVAAFFKRPVVCHLLLKKGGNPYIPNKDNKRPFELTNDLKVKEIFDNHFKKINEKEKEKKLIDINSERRFNYSQESVEDHAKSPNIIPPKQHKYYLYFKNLKARNSLIDIKGKKNEINIVHTIQSFSVSSDEEGEECVKTERAVRKSSIIFYDDSQIFDEETGKNSYMINQPLQKKKTENITDETPSKLKEVIKIKQNIPFKLKNIYTSSLDVKKELNFQSGSKINSNSKPPLPSYRKDIKNLKMPGPKIMLEKQSSQSKKNENIQGSEYNYFNDFFSAKNDEPPSKPKENESLKYVAHYTKNPLTTTNNPNNILRTEGLLLKHSSYSFDASRSILFVNNKVISIHNFLSENNKTIAKSLDFDNESQNNIQNDDKKNINNPKILYSHSLSKSKSYSLMIDLGVDIFNYNAIAGLSFLIFIGYLNDKPEDISFFLQSDDDKLKNNHKLPKKNKQQIGSFLTNLNIKEILKIMEIYCEKFVFREMSFISSLKFFLSNMNVENDPEKIDILLYAFAKKYFKELKKGPNKEENYLSNAFQNIDAVHMLAFATIMFAIEIHHVKRKDVENVILEFNSNVNGLNDGENFEKEFIKNIIENVLVQPIIILSNNTIQNTTSNLRYNFIKNSHLFLNIKKTNKKTNNFKLLQLILIQNLGIIFKNNNDEIPYAVFAIETALMKVKQLVFIICIKPNAQQKDCIIYGKFQESGVLAIKFKEFIEFELMDTQDSQKILKYAHKIKEL